MYPNVVENKGYTKKSAVIQHANLLTKIDSDLASAICNKVMEQFGDLEFVFSVSEYKDNGYYSIIVTDPGITLNLSELASKLDVFKNIFYYDVDFFGDVAEFRIKCYISSNESKSVIHGEIHTKKDTPNIQKFDQLKKNTDDNTVLTIKNLMTTIYRLLVPDHNDNTTSYIFECVFGVVGGFNIIIKNCNNWSNNLIDILKEMTKWELLAENMEIAYANVSMLISLKEKMITFHFTKRKNVELINDETSLLGKRKRVGAPASDEYFNKRSKYD